MARRHCPAVSAVKSTRLGGECCGHAVEAVKTRSAPRSNAPDGHVAERWQPRARYVARRSVLAARLAADRPDEEAEVVA